MNWDGEGLGKLKVHRRSQKQIKFEPSRDLLYDFSYIGFTFEQVYRFFTCQIEFIFLFFYSSIRLQIAFFIPFRNLFICTF